ncbi:MAG: DUF2125 domain-containing protein [Alphaproteobacteria bacterium]|nr:DUF2125 domain-containing protein [Alphaproteobacteria bacterium]
MSPPDTASAPPRRRLGLFAPFVLAAFLSVALAWHWEAMRGRLLARLEALKSPAADRAWTLAYDRVRLNGFPFRLDVTLDDVRLSEPSGWGLATPRLLAEAQLFAPDHFVAFTPEPVTLFRGAAGPVEVHARILRASLSEASARPPRISIEGEDLAFATPPGARPFDLVSARQLNLHSRAGPGGQGALYVGVVGGEARPGSLLRRFAGDASVDLTLDALLSHADRARGPSWPAALRSWAAAPGAVILRQASLAAGPRRIAVRGGEVRFGPEGFAQANLAVTTAGLQAPATTRLVLSGGQARLEPQALAPIPRLF